MLFYHLPLKHVADLSEEPYSCEVAGCQIDSFTRPGHRLTDWAVWFRPQSHFLGLDVID